MWKSNDVKHFLSTINKDLKFDKHVLKLQSKANQKLNCSSKMAKLLCSNKIRKLYRSLNSNIVWLFAFFIVDVPRTKHIEYMREPLEVFMMKMFELLMNYLIWTSLFVFTVKTFKLLLEIYKAHDNALKSFK